MSVKSTLANKSRSNRLYFDNLARQVAVELRLPVEQRDATWYDFEALYSEWFSTPSDQHFVKTALAFWFEDEDYAKSDKIWNYFN